MTASLLLAIVTIAALDSLNPSLFLGQFYLMTTPDPMRRLWSYLAGLLTVNFLGGVLFLAGFATLIAQAWTALSRDALYLGVLVIGIGLIAFGLWLRVTHEPPAQGGAQLKSMRLWHSFTLGGLIMLNELTTALPYLVAIERIAGAGLTWAGNLALLVLYNVVFALPLVLFLLLFMRLRQRFVAQLDRISAALHVWTLRIFKYGSLALGVLMLVGAALYFWDGSDVLAG